MWRFGSGPQITLSATASAVTSSATASKCAGSGSSHDSDESIAAVGQRSRAARAPALLTPPADGQLAIGRFAGATGLAEGGEQLALRVGADGAVGQRTRQLGAARTADRDEQRRRGARQGIQPRVLHREEFTVEALHAALPEQANDADRLGQPRLPDLGLRPASADDVLVQVFPVPSPRKKRPGIMSAHVAAACATMAG